MSSCIDYEKCPRCGGVLHAELNCRTLEELKSCSRCGRRKGWYYVRDEEGKVIPIGDGEYQRETEDLTGFGVAYLQFDRVGICYPFGIPDDKELKEAFYQELQNNDKIIKERCYLTVWDDELGDVRAEYGAVPETFDERERRYEKAAEEEETE